MRPCKLRRGFLSAQGGIQRFQACVSERQLSSRVRLQTVSNSSLLNFLNPDGNLCRRRVREFLEKRNHPRAFETSRDDIEGKKCPLDGLIRTNTQRIAGIGKPHPGLRERTTQSSSWCRNIGDQNDRLTQSRLGLGLFDQTLRQIFRGVIQCMPTFPGEFRRFRRFSRLIRRDLNDLSLIRKHFPKTQLQAFLGLPVQIVDAFREILGLTLQRTTNDRRRIPKAFLLKPCFIASSECLDFLAHRIISHAILQALRVDFGFFPMRKRHPTRLDGQIQSPQECPLPSQSLEFWKMLFQARLREQKPENFLTSRRRKHPRGINSRELLTELRKRLHSVAHEGDALRKNQSLHIFSRESSAHADPGSGFQAAELAAEFFGRKKFFEHGLVDQLRRLGTVRDFHGAVFALLTRSRLADDPGLFSRLFHLSENLRGLRFFHDQHHSDPKIKGASQLSQSQPGMLHKPGVDLCALLKRRKRNLVTNLLGHPRNVQKSRAGDMRQAKDLLLLDQRKNRLRVDPSRRQKLARQGVAFGSHGNEFSPTGCNHCYGNRSIRCR